MKKSKTRRSDGFRPIRISRPTIAWFVASLVAVTLVVSLSASLRRSTVFIISEIVVRQDGEVRQNASDFVYLKGRNLFELDTKLEAQRVSGVYPSYQQVRIIKFYPNQLFIDFIKRKPMACIRAERLLYVDENLVLFRLPDGAPQPAVPVITGVERSLAGAQFGTHCRLTQVSLALQIISLIQQNRTLRDYRLMRIDVLDPANASLFILLNDPASATQPGSAVLEVKIGNESVRDRVKFLATLLAQVQNNLYNIDYIDLRFQEPVIKFKERT